MHWRVHESAICDCVVLFVGADACVRTAVAAPGVSVAPAEVAEEPDDEEAERPTQRRRIELGGWSLSDEDDDGWDAPSPNDR